jgi:hypothetical protein
MWTLSRAGANSALHAARQVIVGTSTKRNGWIPSRALASYARLSDGQVASVDVTDQHLQLERPAVSRPEPPVRLRFRGRLVITVFLGVACGVALALALRSRDPIATLQPHSSGTTVLASSEAESLGRDTKILAAPRFVDRGLDDVELVPGRPGYVS